MCLMENLAADRQQVLNPAFFEKVGRIVPEPTTEGRIDPDDGSLDASREQSARRVIKDIIDRGQRPSRTIHFSESVLAQECFSRVDAGARSA